MFVSAPEAVLLYIQCYCLMVAGVLGCLFDMTGRNGKWIYDLAIRIVYKPQRAVGKWDSGYGSVIWKDIRHDHFRSQLYRLPLDCECIARRVCQYYYNIGTIIIRPGSVDYGIITFCPWKLVE
jgi:hypothetical protein